MYTFHRFSSTPPSFFDLLVKEDNKSNTSEEGILQERVIGHEDGEHAEVGQETLDASDNILGLDPHLAPVGVQFLIDSSVVDIVVITLCQQQLVSCFWPNKNNHGQRG